MPLISLIGLPGGGKSSTGRQLARRLNRAFEDTDAVIERQLGESIRSFFEREGEASFRDVEEAVIRDLSLNFSGVLATGGGAVLRPTNRAQLRENSTVIYLTATPESLMRRLRFDSKRPLLQTDDPLGRLRELYAQRDPLYRETAHFHIATGRPPVSVLVTMILSQLELAGVVDPFTVPSLVDPTLPAPLSSA